MSRILVTGASGYLGSHTTVELLEAGHDVVGVDNLRSSHPEAFRRAGALGNADPHLEILDVRATDRLAGVLDAESIDVVVHFAGLKSVAESTRDPLSYYLTNVAGSLSLLRAMDATGVRRLIFSSSCTVYGESPSCGGTTTGSELRPINPYGRSKAMVEQVLSDVADADPSWEIVSLRYFNPAGAHPSGSIGESPTTAATNLMPLLMSVALDDRDPLVVNGSDYETPDGTCVRDFVHVVDLARAHVAAIDRISPGVRTHNLGTGTGTSVLQLVDAARQVTGCPIPIAVGPRRPGDAPSVVADIDGTATSLGWQAEFGIDRMCEDHWRWLQGNPHGYVD